MSAAVDIILYNSDIIEQKNLCIPHKYMHKRNFVLKPLKEIAPHLIHPKYNKITSAAKKIIIIKIALIPTQSLIKEN